MTVLLWLKNWHEFAYEGFGKNMPQSWTISMKFKIWQIIHSKIVTKSAFQQELHWFWLKRKSLKSRPIEVEIKIWRKNLQRASFFGSKLRKFWQKKSFQGPQIEVWSIISLKHCKEVFWIWTWKNFGRRKPTKPANCGGI